MWGRNKTNDSSKSKSKSKKKTPKPRAELVGPHVNLETWMTDLPPHIRRKVSLCHLTIPGSHNSFTNTITRSSPVGDDVPGWIKRVGNSFGIFAKPIIFRWAVCQHLGCTNQLKQGIRYFDIRLGNFTFYLKPLSGHTTRQPQRASRIPRLRPKPPTPQDRSLYILHGLFGAGIEGMMLECKKFLDEHESEVVILDFQKVYGLTFDEHHELVKSIFKVFNKKLCPVHYSFNVGELTLDYLKRHSYQVIAVYRYIQHDHLWPRNMCHNPWPNTMNIDYLIEFLTNGIETRAGTRFFVSQGILTPQNSTVMRHPFSSLENRVVPVVNEKLKEWVAENTAGGKGGLNIFIADFVETDEFLQRLLVSLNYKTNW